MLLTGAQAFLRLLRQEGVELIFGNPGSTEIALIAALEPERFRYILGLHEGVVTAMADGFAQASGGPAVVNLHAAPGLGNALGMLYNAQKSGTPLIVTAGQHDQDLAVTEPSLWGDTVEMAKPFVKWAVEVRSLAQLPRIVHRAVKTALAPPTGPVFLSLPADVMLDRADIALGAPSRVGAALRADPASIERAVALLAAAERPAVIAGDAVSQSHAHRELVELVELLGAPVYFEGMAHTNVFPPHHRLFHAPLTRTASTVRAALAPYDLIFSVGGDLFTLLTASETEPLPDGLRIIHLDTNPWEIGKNYPTEIGLLGDPRTTLPEISAGLRRHMTESQGSRARQRAAALTSAIAQERRATEEAARLASERSPLQPLAVMRTIGETLPDNAVVVDESISSGSGLRRFLRAQDAQGFFGIRGGSIGWGLAAAIGVKLALPARPVVALVGDGSAMYASQALWTAAHERVPVTFIILNNRSYRILKQRLRGLTGDGRAPNAYVGMDLTDPPINFVSLAQSLGIRAVAADTIAGFSAALSQALVSPEPTLIDVALDSAE